MKEATSKKKATSTLLVKIKVLTIGQNKSSHYWSDWLKRGTVIGGQESSRIQQTQEYKLQPFKMHQSLSQIRSNKKHKTAVSI